MSRGLRVALVHYHLRPGGVASVLRREARALRAAGLEVAVLAGEPAAGAVAVDGLGYDVEARGAAGLAGRLAAAARAALGGPPDLWHVHNSALGKNPGLALALHQFLVAGHRLLLHIHDFAEDGRPALYAVNLAAARAAGLAPGELLFPRSPRAHYAVLTRHDASILRAAGAPAERLHVLPNPVPCGPACPARPDGPWLYPTRALRRKNIGEFLLWAAAAEAGERYAITLSPRSASDRAPYRRWKDLAGRWGLPVEFEVGERDGAAFEDLMGGCRAVGTTSVAEGWGLAFLEPAGWGRAVVGRAIPSALADLDAAGAGHPCCYDRLVVPLSPSEVARLRERIQVEFTGLNDGYGRSVDAAAVAAAVRAAGGEDGADFGHLDEALQADVIERVRADPALRREVRRVAQDRLGAAAERLEPIRTAMAAAFAPERHAAALLDIYAALMAAAPAAIDGLDQERILDAFLDPSRFLLLRT